jgi:membrane protease YdiL (CAAX protease family)
VNALLLMPLALLGVDVGWKELLRPSRRLLAQGLGAAVALYLVGQLVCGGLSAHPAFAGQVAAVYAWRAAVAPPFVVPLLLFIILGEEIVWRSAITLPLAARLGSAIGALAAALGFAAAHLSLGLPVLLLAAFGAGGFWSALVVKTRSAVPSLVCHVLWDLAALFWLPYVGT